jgi:hypothetical protein
MIFSKFETHCMACTLPYTNNTVSVSNPEIPNIDNNNIIYNYNIPDNYGEFFTPRSIVEEMLDKLEEQYILYNTNYTNINICHIIIEEQYPPQKPFKTKRMKQPKFNTKRYHNIHQPGRTNCDQRSRV